MSEDRFMRPELLRALRALDAQFRIEHATGHYSVQWNYEGGELKVARIITPSYDFKFSEQLTHP